MITDDEHKDNLVAHAFGREREEYDYQVNIDNYTAILAGLPTGDVPTEIGPYMHLKVEDLPLSMDDATVQLIADYQFRNRVQLLLRTERIEQSKTRRVKDVIKAQIGPDYDAKLVAFKVKQP